jgi:hypothetical protein
MLFMRALLVCVLGGFLFGAPLASAGSVIRQEQVRFEKGTDRAAITGRITGGQIVDYSFCARAGQSMDVSFKPGNPSAYFNVLAPASGTAIFVGSASGSRFAARLPAGGKYTIRVYLARNAARRNEAASYTIEVGMAGGEATTASAPQAAPATGAAFDRTLELLGIRFRIASANKGSINTLRIVPAGLETGNSPVVRTINGTVTGAEAADLNGDGSPEIYVYVTSAGSGSYGSLVAYSANRRKSLSEIYLSPVNRDKAAAKGYMGHDEFAVVENALVRRFPVYRDTDTNAQACGGMRQLQYRLVAGEAGWILKLDRVVEY